MKNTPMGNQTIDRRVSTRSRSWRPRKSIQTFEGARSVGSAVPEPEEAYDDEEVDDLLRIALDIYNEGIGHRRGWPNNNDDLGDVLVRLTKVWGL